MTSYRTGQVVSYKTTDNPAGTAPGTPRQDYALSPGERQSSGVHELSSVALMTRVLALCQEHGSERLAVRIVRASRSSGGARIASERRLDGVGRRPDAGRRSTTLSGNAEGDKS